MKYQVVSFLFEGEVVKFYTATVDYSGGEVIRVCVEVNPSNFQALLENHIEFNMEDGVYSFITSWQNLCAVKG